MKILVVGKFYTEGFAQHIAETLKAMGYQVEQYQPGLTYTNSTNSLVRKVNKVRFALQDLYARTEWHQRKAQENLVSSVDNTIDLTIVCHDFLTPHQVQGLRQKTQAPVVIWFPDAISNFRSAMFLNAPYDFLFFKEPFAVKVLKNELSKPAFYLPECCNPAYHKPVPLTPDDMSKYQCDITTAGNLHTARVAFFSALRDYNVKIWGHAAPQWMDIQGIERMIQNRYVSNEEKSKCFLASRIVINNLHPTEVFGTNVRTFEVAASGSFQIVSWRPGLDQLYKENEELVAFRNLDELKEKINHYLLNQEDRIRIATNGQKRTHKEHTYENRLLLMLDTIFNRGQGFPIEQNYCL